MIDLIRVDMPEKVYQISGPEYLVKNINEILGSRPNDETVVIITTDLKDDLVLNWKIIPSFQMHELEDILHQMEGDNTGFVLCHFTKEHITVKDTAMSLFENITSSYFVRDILYINRKRWGSYICDDYTCCPIRGKIIK